MAFAFLLKFDVLFQRFSVIQFLNKINQSLFVED